jgi:hypothetical protein
VVVFPAVRATCHLEMVEGKKLEKLAEHKGLTTA